jgi:hypothetical protein
VLAGAGAPSTHSATRATLAGPAGAHNPVAGPDGGTTGRGIATPAA